MRIQNLLFILLLVGLVSCGDQQHKFTVIGDISGLPGGDIYLEEINMNGMVIIDSTQADANGKFELSGQNTEPNMYRLRFTGNRYILLTIDKGNLKINSTWQTLERYDVTGSPSSESLKQLIMVLREHMRDLAKMQAVIDTLASKNEDEDKLASAHASLKEMNISLTRYMEEYADTTQYLPNALFAAQMLNPNTEEVFLESFAQSLNGRFPDSKLAKNFVEKYQEMKAQNAAQQESANGLSIGTQAPEISLPTPADDMVNLSSYRGKYVLVDFWASWCGPCRRENPNVVKAYNMFKNKNFTILGVSLDNNKTKWQDAIAKDKLTWTHVSDLQGWQSVAARDYKVNGIPANFLIDPEGNIIATNLRGDALFAKLNEVLNK